MVRTGLDAAAAGRWDPGLVRESRVLVPIDVQALVVAAGDAEPIVRIPLALTAPDGQDPETPTAVLEDGPPRPAGVHLHWAAPDALLRGTLADTAGATRLGLPALPDRWVVLRLLVPKGASAPVVRGWVLEADTARAVDLAGVAGGRRGRHAGGTDRRRPPSLTGSVGGSLNWVGVYDAVTNRLAFHDPLDDLATVAPNGAEGDQAAYVVAGWWSTAEPRPARRRADELEPARPARRARLGAGRRRRGRRPGRRRALGAGRAARQPRPSDQRPLRARAATRPRSAAPARRRRARRSAPRRRRSTRDLSVFADEAISVQPAEPAWPRSMLLHGARLRRPPGDRAEGRQPPGHGAARRRARRARRRPRRRPRLLGPRPRRTRRATRARAPAGGVHRPAARSRRHARRPRRHRGARARRRVRRSPRRRGRHRPAADRPPGGGRRRRPPGARRRPRASRPASSRRRSPPSPASAATSCARARTTSARRSSRPPAARAPRPSPPPQSREVTRPAPRLIIPGEPMVAVRGAARSLRHGGDGRFSPDGRLHCRWPSQVTRGYQQLIQGADVLPSLGTAAVPDEVLLLAREAMRHATRTWSPWMAAWRRPRGGLDPPATASRLVAEATLRFGADATYDGRTAAFRVADAGLQRPRRRGARTRLARRARRRSAAPLLAGGGHRSRPGRRHRVVAAVGAAVARVGGRSSHLADRLDGWVLGRRRRADAEDGAAPAPATRTLRGRSALTTGTATTLGRRRARRGWPPRTHAIANNAGEADEATEAALTTIADAIEQLDVVAASLDGIREQLLGLVYDGGLLRTPRRRRDARARRPPPARRRAPARRHAHGHRARAWSTPSAARSSCPAGPPAVPVRTEVPETPGSPAPAPAPHGAGRLLFRLDRCRRRRRRRGRGARRPGRRRRRP